MLLDEIVELHSAQAASSCDDSGGSCSSPSADDLSDLEFNFAQERRSTKKKKGAQGSKKRRSASRNKAGEVPELWTHIRHGARLEQKANSEQVSNSEPVTPGPPPKDDPGDAPRR